MKKISNLVVGLGSLLKKVSRLILGHRGTLWLVFERYYNLLGTSTKKELDLIKLKPAYKIYSGDEALTIFGDRSVI